MYGILYKSENEPEPYTAKLSLEYNYEYKKQGAEGNSVVPFLQSSKTKPNNIIWGHIKLF